MTSKAAKNTLNTYNSLLDADNTTQTYNLKQTETNQITSIILPRSKYNHGEGREYSE